MSKMIGGAKPVNPLVAGMQKVGTPVPNDVATPSATATADVTNRTMAEELAGKKKARTRGGSRMLLSAERLNAQEGLSASSTLG